MNRYFGYYLFFQALTASVTASADFKVHEWGTFTSLVGSNGVTQDGMYHEDEVLPDFVHGFGETRQIQIPDNEGRFGCPPDEPKCFPRHFLRGNVVTQKMETPVVYFYSDTPRNVRLEVDFPQGVLSQTYPAPVVNLPNRESAPILANGKAIFELEVLTSLADPAIPPVENGNIYGHARNVASNVVQSGTEKEKFVFYRGLGRFQPKIQITSQNGSLRIAQCAGCPRVPGLFLVHADESGRSAFRALGSLNYSHFGVEKSVSAEEINRLKNATPHYAPGENLQARGHLLKSLMNAGLFQDEATAMIDTWEHGYLGVPGLRLLYILPESEVEGILPLRVTPQPDSLRRAFVGRIEILLDTEEKQLVAQILRTGDLFEPKSLGRFAEPILKRLLEVYASGATGTPSKGPLDLFHRLIERVSTR
jgi:hypothetical protein